MIGVDFAESALQVIMSMKVRARLGADPRQVREASRRSSRL